MYAAVFFFTGTASRPPGSREVGVAGAGPPAGHTLLRTRMGSGAEVEVTRRGAETVEVLLGPPSPWPALLAASHSASSPRLAMGEVASRAAGSASGLQARSSGPGTALTGSGKPVRTLLARHVKPSGGSGSWAMPPSAELAGRARLQGPGGLVSSPGACQPRSCDVDKSLCRCRTARTRVANAVAA